jgi:hypothetical protein
MSWVGKLPKGQERCHLVVTFLAFAGKKRPADLLGTAIALGSFRREPGVDQR